MHPSLQFHFFDKRNSPTSDVWGIARRIGAGAGNGLGVRRRRFRCAKAFVRGTHSCLLGWPERSFGVVKRILPYGQTNPSAGSLNFLENSNIRIPLIISTINNARQNSRFPPQATSRTKNGAKRQASILFSSFGLRKKGNNRHRTKSPQRGRNNKARGLPRVKMHAISAGCKSATNFILHYFVADLQPAELVYHPYPGQAPGFVVTGFQPSFMACSHKSKTSILFFYSERERLISSLFLSAAGPDRRGSASRGRCCPSGQRKGDRCILHGECRVPSSARYSSC